MFMYVVLHGAAQIPVWKARNQAQIELKQTRIGHQGKAIYVNTATQMTLVEAQNRAQNELKYLCSDEEHQHRHTHAYVCCFAWDSSNSSGKGSKSSSKCAQTNMSRTPR